MKEVAFTIDKICDKCDKHKKCSDSTVCINKAQKIVLKEMHDNCETFYKVFKQLEQVCFLKTDLEKIGLEQFRENDKFLVPCIVNGVFATEVALKLLCF